MEICQAYHSKVLLTLNRESIRFSGKNVMVHLPRASDLLIKIWKNEIFSPHMTIFALIRAVAKNFLGIPFLCWSSGEPPYRSEARVWEAS